MRIIGQIKESDELNDTYLKFEENVRIYLKIRNLTTLQHGIDMKTRKDNDVSL